MAFLAEEGREKKKKKKSRKEFRNGYTPSKQVDPAVLTTKY